ncbi:RHS repeat domain-containing protein [Aquimarina sp. LLG6339-5]|uniref:RHS repeat domain-containing protein n=1 Tax=Aquimarina sp. LLG6339-5 TaxID=3160830 RepID=UPI00386AE55B
MPTVIPPSPEAASITKYVDMKINEYRGMVQHQIPIYQITDGMINLPISLNYQSGGFKVVESSSSVGLGWSLNAGGVITRSMNGVPDDELGLAEGFLTLSSQIDYNYLNGGTDPNRYRLLHSIGIGCKDAQPDIFNFNVNGYSGKFHFDWDGTIVVASESEIMITPIQGIPDKPTITGWIINTPDGFTYTFDAIETTSNIASSAGICYLAQQGFNSSWYLTEITDPFHQRKLFFEYDTYRVNEYNVHKSQSRLHFTGGSGTHCSGSISGSSQFSNTTINIEGRVLKRIYSNTSPIEVVFIQGTNRVMNTSDDFYALSEIQIKNRIQDKLIKKYELKHNYNTGRLSLASVQEFGNSSSTIPPYEFIYHDALPERTSSRKDHWGYTNNNSTTEMLPPYYIKTNNLVISQGTADRSPDFEGSRKGVLHKVIYPTGGYDEYIFEQNTYGKISNLQVNEYITTLAGNTVGALGNSGLGCSATITTTNTDIFIININPETNDPEEEIPVYIRGSVEKYTEDYLGLGLGPKAKIINDEGEEILKISLINNSVNTNILLTPGNYTIVAEATWKDCNSSATDRASLSVTYQNYTTDRLYEKPIGGVRVKSMQKYDANNRLLLTQEYDYIDTNGYSSGFINKEPNYVYSRENFVFVAGNTAGGVNYNCNYYVALDSDRSNLGITTGGHVGYKTVSISQKSENETNGTTILNFTGGVNIVYDELPFPPPIDYSFSGGKIKSIQLKDASNKLIKETINTYQNKEELTYAMKVQFKGGALMGNLEELFNIKRYFVRMAHIKLVKQEVIDSLHDEKYTITTEYLYNQALQKLKEKKILQEKEVRREVFYYPEDSSLLDNIDSNEAANYQKLVDAFRIANPIQTESYIKAKNESEKLISKSRVKYDENENTSSLLKRISLEAAKGNNELETRVLFDKYDNIGNILQTKKEDGAHISYIWGYNKQYPVAKVENATRAEIEALSGFGADFHTGSGGLTAVQETRLRSLPNAMVSTYLYEPLIGVTSMTDPRGYTMTYHYDSFNRLEFVKDADGNLVSENKYNYKN